MEQRAVPDPASSPRRRRASFKMSPAPPSFPFSPFPWFFSPLTALSSSSLVHRKAMALELHPRPSPSARPRSILPMQPATSSSSFVRPSARERRDASLLSRPRGSPSTSSPPPSHRPRPRPCHSPVTSSFTRCWNPSALSRTCKVSSPEPVGFSSSATSRSARLAHPHRPRGPGLNSPPDPFPLGVHDELRPVSSRPAARCLFVARFPCFCVRGG